MADKYEYSDKYKAPEMVGGFVTLFKKDDNGRFGLTGIYEDGYPKSVKQAMQQAAKKCWGDKAGKMVKHAKFKSPLQRGSDVVDREGERFAGFEDDDYVVKFATKKKPGVADRRVRRIVSAEGETIVDKETDDIELVEANEVYRGALYVCTFQALAFDRDDGFGISLQLENVQKTGEGERISGGRADVSEDFEPLDGDDPFDEDEGEDDDDMFDD